MTGFERLSSEFVHGFDCFLSSSHFSSLYYCGAILASTAVSLFSWSPQWVGCSTQNLGGSSFTHIVDCICKLNRTFFEPSPQPYPFHHDPEYNA